MFDEQIVTASEVADVLGRPLEAEEIKQVQFWIRVAMMKIRKRLGDPALLDQDALSIVVTAAVARYAANPEGHESVRIDDFSYRIGKDARKVEVDLTDEEWRLLTPKREATFGVITAAHHIGDRCGNYGDYGGGW